MGLEAASLIHQLDPLNPTGLDAKGQGDDHIRMLKTCLKNNFPNVNAAITASDEEINKLVGFTGSLNGITNISVATFAAVLTNVQNAPGILDLGHRYLRINSIVIVSGAVGFTAAAGSTVVVGIAPPIASNFSSSNQVGGGGGAVYSAGIFPLGFATDSTNDRVHISFVQSPVGQTVTLSYIFMYQVL